MSTGEAILVVELFPLLNGKLIELLKSLNDEEWHRSTICALWNVKDIAAHLLDGMIRRVSFCRDGYNRNRPENINSYQELVEFINRLNAEGVSYGKRLSPQILIGLLEQFSDEVYQYFRTLEPFSAAPFSVAWAGEQQSLSWFDIAREYTEHWHHQQQIRLAVDKPGIMERALYFPVLEAFMRALPHTYRNVAAENDALLQFQISGEAGGNWYLQRVNNHWQLVSTANTEPLTTVIVPQELAWRVFTKGIDKEAAKSQSIIKGEQLLGSEIFNMLAVMA
jgi:uncharacterized protein (TIGR03083 family)